MNGFVDASVTNTARLERIRDGLRPIDWRENLRI
jgi:hypothetical protein